MIAINPQFFVKRYQLNDMRIGLLDFKATAVFSFKKPGLSSVWRSSKMAFQYQE